MNPGDLLVIDDGVLDDDALEVMIPAGTHLLYVREFIVSGNFAGHVVVDSISGKRFVLNDVNFSARDGITHAHGKFSDLPVFARPWHRYS